MAAQHTSPADVRQAFPSPGLPASIQTHDDSDAFPSSAGWTENHVAQPSQQAYNEPRPLQEYHSAYSDAEPTSSRPSTHGRQQSFTNFLPRSIRERIPSPERRKPIPVFEEMPLTGDGTKGRQSESTRGGIGGLLSGMSAPVALGFHNRSEGDSPSRASTPDTTPTRLRKSQTTAFDVPTPKSNASSTGRFAFLASSMSAISRFTQGSASPGPDDELAGIDVEAALFPAGPPTDRDTFSPAAFKNLQANATGLLLKMQGAYRQRLAALRELEAEREAQREELEEAETRAAHLKMQLEGMALRAAEQERDMRRLAEELGAERRARAEERERAAREKAGPAVREHVLMLSSEGGSTVSEDLGVDEEEQQRRRLRKRRDWRESAGTVKSEASSFDTDEESAGDESVFSRSRSPTIALPPGSGAESSAGRLSGSGRPRAAAPQMSTFQKIIKNISGDQPRDQEEQGSGYDGCGNCRGQDASVAWDTVSLLRDENKALKQRVGQLEVAVEGALDMVNGIGI